MRSIKTANLAAYNPTAYNCTNASSYTYAISSSHVYTNQVPHVQAHTNTDFCPKFATEPTTDDTPYPSTYTSTKSLANHYSACIVLSYTRTEHISSTCSDYKRTIPGTRDRQSDNAAIVSTHPKPDGQSNDNVEPNRSSHNCHFCQPIQ